MTEYYTPSGKPEFESRALSVEVRNEFVTIQYSFDSVQTDMLARSVSSGQVYTGVHDFSGATLYAKTLAYGASGNQVATVDYVNAAQFQAIDLPGQAGKSGYALFTNGTNPYWALVAGAGGANITGNITLTAGSAAAMTVSPTSAGLYATLPDSTTCIKTTTMFSFYNAGDYDYGVKNSAGTQIGWIRPRTGAIVGLSDNATAAGSWTHYGLEKTGVTAKLLLPTVSGSNLGNLVSIALDSTRTCFVFGAANCYAIVYDSSSQTWGAPTLIRVVDDRMFSAVLSSANQVLVVSYATTAMEAVTITISGTGITVNSGTKGSATLSTVVNTSTSPTLVAVGSSFVASYTRTPGAPDSGIRAISVSGTTPTIGAESALLVGNLPIVFASGSVARCISWNTTQVRCSPFTVSGSTLTLGTAANVTSTSVGLFRAILNSNGNIVVDYANTTHYVSVFKLTGTTEAATSVNIGQVPTDSQKTTALQATASKIVYCTVASNVIYLNTVTDTAGTASAGTEAQIANIGTLSTVGASSVINSIGVFLVHGTSTAVHKIDVSFSTASPVVNSVSAVCASLVPTAAFMNSKGIRNPLALINTDVIYSISTDVSAKSITATYGTIYQVNAPSLLTPNYVAVNGASNTESFFQTGSGTGTSPVTFQKVEAAA